MTHTPNPNAGALLVIGKLRDAGIALVELPAPDTSTPSWRIILPGDGEPEDIYPLSNGMVRISGVDDIPSQQARHLAAVLIAAADHAEKGTQS